MIYLDHNATTPVLLEVIEAMQPFFTERWGNPSSSYRFGSELKSVIEAARVKVAELLDQEGIGGSSGSACLADSDEPSHVVKR